MATDRSVWCFHVASALMFLAANATVYTWIIATRAISSSDGLTSLTYVLHLLPAIPLSVFAGALLDRHPRWRVMQLAQGAFGVATAAAALGVHLALSRPEYAWWICPALAGTAGIALAFVTPARLALAGDLVQGRSLESTTILINLANIVGFGVAPVVCGLLKTMYGWEAIYVAVLGLSLAAVIALASVRPAPRARPERTTLAETIPAASRILSELPLCRPLLLVVLLATSIMGVVQVLLPQFAHAVLGLQEVGRGVLMSWLAVGLFAGTLLGRLLNRVESRGWIILGSACLAGVILCAFGFVRSSLAAAAVAVIGGIFGGLTNALVVAVLQATTPDGVRGRVMGLYSLAFQSAPLLGAMLAGSLAELIGIPATLRAMGGLILATSLLLLVRSSELRSYR